MAIPGPSAVATDVSTGPTFGSPPSSGYPTISLDAQGNAADAWIAGTNTIVAAVYNTSTGWGLPSVLTGDLAGDYTTPPLVASLGNGDFVVVYGDGYKIWSVIYRH